MKRILGAVFGLGLAVVAVGATAATTETMTKIVTRDLFPSPAAGSFAEKPKTLYRVGTRLARMEEAPDPERGLHVLGVYADSDMWFANLIDKSGRKIRDRGETTGFHAPVLPPLRPRSPPPFAEELELGTELQFLRDRGAVKGKVTQESVVYDSLELKLGDYGFTLLCRAGTDQPVRLTATRRGKTEQVVQYDEYRTGLPVDMSLFQPPKDVKFVEEPIPKKGRKMSAEDVSDWMSFYYLEPEPKQTTAALAAMRSEGLLSNPDSREPVAAFLSFVFAANGEQLGALVPDMKGWTPDDRLAIGRALWYANTSPTLDLLRTKAVELDDAGLRKLVGLAVPVIEKVPIDKPAVLDLQWGAFFATGDPKYVLRVVSALTKTDSTDKTGDSILKKAAMWSLASNAAQHEKVMDICKERLARAQPQEAKLLKEIVAKAEEATGSPDNPANR